MKSLPIFASGTLSSQNIKHANLFEVELAILNITNAAASGSNTIVVDDIDKCFVGQLLCYEVTSNSAGYDYYNISISSVTAISTILNQVTISPVLEKSLTTTTQLFETLYTTAALPQIKISSATADITERLQLWHSAKGTLTGKLLLTDYDVPIVVRTERIFSLSDTGYATYLPYSIKHRGTSYDTKGKLSNVDITIGEVDQEFIDVLLTHNALKKRNVTIKTAYLGSSTVFNLNVPVTVDTQHVIYAGVTDTNYVPIDSSIIPFNNAIYDLDESNQVVEFEGQIETVSFNNEAAQLTIVNKLEANDDTIIPRRLFSRSRCQVNYKDASCRFLSSLKVMTELASGTTDWIYVGCPTSFKFYFKEMEVGETHIIQIDNEQILINGYDQYNALPAPQEYWNKLGATQRTYVTANPTYYTYRLSIATSATNGVAGRGYNSTTPVIHAVSSTVDTLLCRKTFHDCRLHYNEFMINNFPAIPKKVYY